MSDHREKDWNTRLLTAINSVQREFVGDGGTRSAFCRLLDELLALTGSEYGFVGEVLTSPEGLPYLKTYAITDIAWNEESRRFYDQYEAEGMEFHNLETLFGRVLTTGRPLVANDPANHPAAGGLPPGHPGMANFIGLPLHVGDRFVGMAGLANRPGGYDEELVAGLEPILQAAAYMIIAGRERKARKLAERSASLGAKLRASVIETALDCVIAIDHEGRVLEFNPASESLFGWDRSEALGQLLGDLIVPERMREAHRAGMEKFLATGVGPVIGKRIEVPALRRDGTEFPIELAITVAEVDERPIFTAYIRDITQRREAEEAIRQGKEAAEAASRAKSTFVATVSHEIRTPINAILGALGLLETVPLDARHRAFLETAQASAKALHGLVSDVLDFSRIEAGKVELEEAPVDVAELCDSVLQLMKGRARDQGTALGCVIDPEVPSCVAVDGGKIRQVLLNIVGNAVKFAGAGSVRIDVAVSQGYLRFDVEDNGVGIAEKDLKMLFTEFLQFGDARAKGGTGLGLAICKRLVELMGGEISASSVRGQGSVFAFTVPYEAVADAPRRARFSGRALLVGNADFTAGVLEDQLQASGMDVERVPDVSGACRSLAGGGRYAAAFYLLGSARDHGCMDEGMDLARQCSAMKIPLAVIVPEDPDCAECAEDKLHATRGLTLPVLNEDLADCLARMFRPPGLPESTLSGRTEAMQPGAAGVRVLLAEDSQANRLVMAEILRRGGFEIDTVGNGVEAVEAVRSLPYDVVLMDLDMPIMDGLSATREIRGLGGDLGQIPIIALTAHAMEDTREQIGEAGLSDFLTKPVERETLFARILHWAVGQSAREPAPGEALAGDSMLVDRETLDQLGRDTSPELVPKLVQVFIRELEGRAGSIAEAMEAEDLGALGREAHALKSSAATYGALALAHWARALDAACKAGERRAALEAARRIGELTNPTAEALTSSLPD